MNAINKNLACSLTEISLRRSSILAFKTAPIKKNFAINFFFPFFDILIPNYWFEKEDDLIFHYNC